MSLPILRPSIRNKKSVSMTILYQEGAMPNELHIPHFDYDQFLQGCVESISDPIEHIIHEGDSTRGCQGMPHRDSTAPPEQSYLILGDVTFYQDNSVPEEDVIHGDSTAIFVDDSFYEDCSVVNIGNVKLVQESVGAGEDHALENTLDTQGIVHERKVPLGNMFGSYTVSFESMETMNIVHERNAADEHILDKMDRAHQNNPVQNLQEYSSPPAPFNLPPLAILDDEDLVDDDYMDENIENFGNFEPSRMGRVNVHVVVESTVVCSDIDSDLAGEDYSDGEDSSDEFYTAVSIVVGNDTDSIRSVEASIAGMSMVDGSTYDFSNDKQGASLDEVGSRPKTPDDANEEQDIYGASPILKKAELVESISAIPNSNTPEENSTSIAIRLPPNANTTLTGSYFSLNPSTPASNHEAILFDNDSYILQYRGLYRGLFLNSNISRPPPPPTSPFPAGEIWYSVKFIVKLHNQTTMIDGVETSVWKRWDGAGGECARVDGEGVGGGVVVGVVNFTVEGEWWEAVEEAVEEKEFVANAETVWMNGERMVF